MNQLSHSILSLMEELIELNKESHYGYLKAAEVTEEPVYERMFLSYAHYRKQFADELERQVKAEFGEAAFTESLLESLYRGWKNVNKYAMGLESEISDQERCLQIDTQVLEAYERALQTSMPVKILLTLTKQHASLQAACKKIRTFKEVLA